MKSVSDEPADTIDDTAFQSSGILQNPAFYALIFCTSANICDTMHDRLMNAMNFQAPKLILEDIRKERQDLPPPPPPPPTKKKYRTKEAE